MPARPAMVGTGWEERLEHDFSFVEFVELEPLTSHSTVSPMIGHPGPCSHRPHEGLFPGVVAMKKDSNLETLGNLETV